jgi:diguanylate cyclase (GGDEF)-like protein
VISGADLVDGIRVGERIRCAVEALAIRHDAVPLKHVTVSVGVAAVAASSHGSPENLIATADAALYKAKSEGRNGVWPRVDPADVPDPAAAAAAAAGAGSAGLNHAA